MIINIVGGSGVMGRIHKKIFEKAGHKVIISGRNSNISVEDSAKKSDVTIISVPIEVTEEIIKKIAPYCKAIMDFTSLKVSPINNMLEYSNSNCEVCGLHPLYGEVDNIKDKTIIVCKTKKTGKISNEIIDCLKKEGANIIEMNPEEHDKKVLSLNQVLRIKIISAFAQTIKDSGLNIKDFYSISSPPTKLMIELISRQVNEKNDVMYDNMIKGDIFAEDIENKFIDNMKNIDKNYKELAKEIRDSFGDEFLNKLQEKIKKNID